ncbi:MAG: hypothetical protein JW742_01605 [Candidatus Aminicenantes bacterium]|nr:hypothetical protein [Candidatus Aminicenantes bacterium]
MTPRLPARWIRYLTEAPRFEGLFLCSPRGLAALRVGRKDGRVSGAAVLPLRAGSVVPSFDRPNLPDPGPLEDKVKEAAARLGIADRTAACLIPDICARAVLLAFDGLPGGEREREKVVRWRVQKQMPLLAEGTRLVYEVVGTSPLRVLAVLVKEAVVREYEAAFARARFRVGYLGIPSLSLLNLAGVETLRDGLLVNVEDDSLSLMGFQAGELALYRLKPLAADVGRASRRLPEMVQEVENTLRSIEDREKKQIQALGLRMGVADPGGALREGFRRAISIPVVEVAPPAAAGFETAESPLLIPLLGLLP